MNKFNLVIDTDVGTDVDDLFALVYAMKSGANIKAISTVHGDTELRGKIVRKLERIIGKDIPIICGNSCSEESIKRYWTGIEKEALTKDEINEKLEPLPFPEYDSDTRLVCIGPLTNIAHQLDNNPSIKNVKKVYVMGSSMDSHNFLVDKESTKKIFNQDWEIYQIRKKESLKIHFTKDELKKMKGDELGDFLCESGIRGMDHMHRPYCAMYDALVVSAALGEDYVKFKRDDEKYVSYDVDINLKQKILDSIIK